MYGALSLGAILQALYLLCRHKFRLVHKFKSEGIHSTVALWQIYIKFISCKNVWLPNFSCHLTIPQWIVWQENNF